MKKLISALTVKQAHKDGLREINAPSKATLITPEARSVAKELGITLVENSAVSSANDQPAAALPVDEKQVQQIVEKVIEQLPPEKRRPEVIKNVVLDVLSKYMKQG